MILDNTKITKFYKQVEKQFIKWAKTQDHIRIAFVVGSRARTDTPADKWSDLDIIIISTEPQNLIGKAEWVSEFGNPIITFIEPTAGGSGESYERRVLYDNGLDVDFAVDPYTVIIEGQKRGMTPEFVNETRNIAFINCP